MLADLPWLPPAATDFRDRVRAIRAEAAAPGPGFFERVVELGTAALDENQLSQLTRLVVDLRTAAPPEFSKVRLGLLGDGTLSLLAPVIMGSGVRHSVLFEVVEGAYGSTVQQALDPTGPLHTADLDMLLLASDARMLGLTRAADTAEDATACVESAFSQLKLIVDRFRPAVSAAVLVQTLPLPLEPLFGSFDAVEPTSPYAMIQALNAKISDWAGAGDVVLVDIARLAATVGIERWDAPGHWFASKLPFAPEMAPVYGDVIARLVASLRGRARKCLVLDLDNTLWGGVIGDDGVAGIKLGQGSAAGEAHLAVQELAFALRRRGVILAVCSKNEEAAALLPFREHPDMVLKEDHIAVFQANWTDKAANLRTIAQTLNIGIDALVFLDDNPAERAQVRRELPLVAVPELPEDPALYARTLAAAGYFETVTFTQDDRSRAAMYQANAARVRAVEASGDLEGYLNSLEMVCTIASVNANSRARVAQLVNKSNQYNLTTRRYTEAQVAAAEADPRRHVSQIRLIDKFGDNGIISVLIADRHDDHWDVDTWLMSCRVLGRRVQEAALAHLASAALRDGARRLVGHYVPSPKNAMVRDHYEKLGFEKVEEAADGSTTWALDLSTFSMPELPMTIEDDTMASHEKAAG